MLEEALALDVERAGVGRLDRRGGRRGRRGVVIVAVPPACDVLSVSVAVARVPDVTTTLESVPSDDVKSDGCEPVGQSAPIPASVSV